MKYLKNLTDKINKNIVVHEVLLFLDRCEINTSKKKGSRANTKPVKLLYVVLSVQRGSLSGVTSVTEKGNNHFSEKTTGAKFQI